MTAAQHLTTRKKNNLSCIPPTNQKKCSITASWGLKCTRGSGAWDWLTLVEKGESLGPVGAVGVEVQDDVVRRDVEHLPRRVAPVEACQHPVAVAVQQLHHVRLVRDVEEGEVEEEGGGARHVDGPVAHAARRVLVGEVRGVDDVRGGGVVPAAGPHLGCRDVTF